MSEKYDSFLSYLSIGCHILDLGCGSGRDSLYLINNGYYVTAAEASPKLSDYSLQPKGWEVLFFE